MLEPVGTAPGLLVGRRRRWWRCCPGLRASCRRCGRTPSRPSPLRELLARAGTLEQRILRFFPLPEPQIAATLRELDADALPLEITTCLRRGELEVATVFEPARADAYDGLEAALRERHGDVLFSDDGATIDVVIARLLARAHDRDRRVVHRRPDGGPADRPRGLLGLRPGRARGLFQRGQDRAGRGSGRVDRGARRGLARGRHRAVGGRALAPGGRPRDRHHRDRRAGRRHRPRSRSERCVCPSARPTIARSAPSGSPAAAPTCATARPRSPSTCCRALLLRA